MSVQKSSTLKIDGFDWDEGNYEKCQKHDVPILEIESLFEMEPLVKTNTKHLSGEARYQAVGKGKSGRYLFVIFTIRNIKRANLIRPISA